MHPIKETRQALAYSVTLRRVRLTILAVENQEVLNVICVCSLIYPEPKAHALPHVAICGLSGCTARDVPYCPIKNRICEKCY